MSALEQRGAPAAPASRLAPVLAVGVYLALALWAFFPAWTRPSAFIVGDWRNPDCLSNHWLFQWIPETLRAGGSILHNDRYYYPQGDAPFLAGNGSDALLYAPFHYLLGWPAGLTVYELLLVVGACLGGYLACRKLGSSSLAAIFGGAVIGFNPYIVGELSAGRFAQVPLVWLALFLAAFVALLEQPSGRRAAVAAVLYAVNAFVYWYYGLFATLAGAVIAAAFALAHRSALRSRLAPLAQFSAFSAGLLAWPMTLFFTRWQAIPGVEEAFPSPWSVVTARLPAWPFWEPPRPEGVMIVPAAALILAGFALWRARRRGEAPDRWKDGALLAVAVLFYLLSLGPWLKRIDSPPYQGLKLPYYWLYGLARPLERFWWPTRHVILVYFAFGALAARALTRLERRLPAALAIGLPVALSLLLPLDFALRGASVRIAQSTWSPPQAYQALAKQPGTLLLELPIAPDVVTTQQSLLYQPLHGKQLIGGHAMWVRRVRPAGWDDWVRANSFLEALVGYELGKGSDSFRFQAKDLEALRAAGLRIVTINRELYPEAFRGLYLGERSLMWTLFGAPVLTGPYFQAFDIGHWTGELEARPGKFQWPAGIPPADGNHPLPLVTFPSPSLERVSNFVAGRKSVPYNRP